MSEKNNLEFDVRGMTCESCAHHVERALKSVDGVAEVDIPGWESGRATVAVEGDVSAEALSEAVAKAGYSAILNTPRATTNGDNQYELEFDVRGMTCESCADHVEHALTSVAGVKEASVPGWDSSKVNVVADGEVATEALSEAVKAAGYGATLKTRKLMGAPASTNGDGAHDFDLMVIGGGSAGFGAAIKGVELGYKVALVEAGDIGGTCVNVGCVPSKTMIRALETHHLAGEQRFNGVHTTAGQLNWPQVIDHKAELVGQLQQAKYWDVLTAYPDVTYISGYARLTEGGAVEIDGQPYKPNKIVITTGASPWAPPIPGLKEAGYIDSTAALELKELPKSMVVLGANAVGLEIAQTYARASTYVTVLEVLPRIAPFEDEDISIGLEGYLTAEGLRIVTNFSTSKVEKRDGRYLLSGTQDGAEMTFEAEQLLVATGRRPNTSGFGLKEAGVELDKRGEIVVDETLLTSNPNVYAAGDVTGKDMFVYTAAYGGMLAAENALTGAGRATETDYIARITFTDPQVASAGLTEAQAREAGHEVKVSTLEMSHVPRALAARDTRGLVKLVADADSDRLLGAHILAPEGGEIIQIASMAMRFGITVEQLRSTIFPYLTNVEAIKLATVAFEKDVALLSCCAG